MEKLKNYADLVKFEHTVFALPFALAGILLLMEEVPSLWRVVWILVAFVSARTLGMALNRLIDEPYDRENPRTKDWPHASGKVSREEVKVLILISGGAFLISSLMINFLAFLLSPLVILLLWAYPYAKRFTHYPHLVLGLVYLLIPVAVDIALNERVSLEALVLGTAMALWVAGFDILYSLQDYDFDREKGLKSIPVLVGVGGAIKVARIFHLGTFLCLVVLGVMDRDLGLVYFAGLTLLALFLIYEHTLVRPDDLSKINRAFFTVNGYVSIAFFLTVALEFLI
ncbi:MAG: UbiA-like polyprenyltransferase [Aquificota bacterium]|nr:UbiA-like polyprenyltransferase [Aquificota bacterium]